MTGANVTSTGGDITVTADNIAIDPTSTIDAGAGCVVLQQVSAGQVVDLGGVDAAGVLGLTDAELDRVTTHVANRRSAGRANRPWFYRRPASHRHHHSGRQRLHHVGPAGRRKHIRNPSPLAPGIVTTGTLTVDNLLVQAGGSVTLDQANAIGVIAGTSGGAFVATNGATTLTVGTVTACGVTVSGIPSVGDITITADTLEITAPIVTTGCVTIQQATPTRGINLGTPEDATALSLKDSELDFITAGAGLQLGRDPAEAGYTGSITIVSPITQAGSGYTHLALRSGGTTTEMATGAITVDNLAVASKGAVTLNGDNGVTRLAGTVTAAGATFQFTEAPGQKLTVDAFAACATAYNGIATNAGDITLTIDDLDILAPINAGVGSVALQPRSTAQNVTVGTEPGRHARADQRRAEFSDRPRSNRRPQRCRIYRCSPGYRRRSL